MVNIRKNNKLKKVIFIAAFIMGACHVSAQTKTNLDRSIQNIVANLSQKLNQDDNIAVLNIEAPTKELSDYIIDEITIGLINLNIKVMERKKLELLEQELRFNMSGFISDETAQRVGYFIGVKTIISGSFSSFGNDYRLRIQATTVETTQIIGARIETVANDKILTRLLGDNNPKNDWKNKRVYIGMWPGFGAALISDYYIEDQKYISYGAFFLYQLSHLFAIGIDGTGAYYTKERFSGKNTFFISAVPTLTLRPSKFEIELFVGPAVGSGSNLDKAKLGFAVTGGVRAGYNIGPGIVFSDFRIISDLGYSLGIGYKIGFGNRK